MTKATVQSRLLLDKQGYFSHCCDLTFIHVLRFVYTFFTDELIFLEPIYFHALGNKCVFEIVVIYNGCHAFS